MLQVNDAIPDPESTDPLEAATLLGGMLMDVILQVESFIADAEVSEAAYYAMIAARLQACGMVEGASYLSQVEGGYAGIMERVIEHFVDVPGGILP